LQGDEITLSGYVGEDEASPESSSGASSWSGETVIAEDSDEKVLNIFLLFSYVFCTKLTSIVGIISFIKQKNDTSSEELQANDKVFKVHASDVFQLG
jgi:hypothetical protein